jgi:hypothetical protein
VRLRKWSLYSKLYLIFTSYKLLNNGESCTGENSGMASPVQMRKWYGQPCTDENVVRPVLYR